MNSNTTVLALTAIILALLAIIREDLRAGRRGYVGAPVPGGKSPHSNPVKASA